jgi:hypothetical protein
VVFFEDDTVIADIEGALGSIERAQRRGQGAASTAASHGGGGAASAPASSAASTFSQAGRGAASAVDARSPQKRRRPAAAPAASLPGSTRHAGGGLDQAGDGGRSAAAGDSSRGDTGFSQHASAGEGRSQRRRPADASADRGSGGGGASSSSLSATLHPAAAGAASSAASHSGKRGQAREGGAIDIDSLLAGYDAAAAAASTGSAAAAARRERAVLPGTDTVGTSSSARSAGGSASGLAPSPDRWQAQPAEAGGAASGRHGSSATPFGSADGGRHSAAAQASHRTATAAAAAAAAAEGPMQEHSAWVAHKDAAAARPHGSGSLADSLRGEGGLAELLCSSSGPGATGAGTRGPTPPWESLASPPPPVPQQFSRQAAAALGGRRHAHSDAPWSQTRSSAPTSAEMSSRDWGGAAEARRGGFAPVSALAAEPPAGPAPPHLAPAAAGASRHPGLWSASDPHGAASAGAADFGVVSSAAPLHARSKWLQPGAAAGTLEALSGSSGGLGGGTSGAASSSGGINFIDAGEPPRSRQSARARDEGAAGDVLSGSYGPSGSRPPLPFAAVGARDSGRAADSRGSSRLGDTYRQGPQAAASSASGYAAAGPDAGSWVGGGTAAALAALGISGGADFSRPPGSSQQGSDAALLHDSLALHVVGSRPSGGSRGSSRGPAAGGLHGDATPRGSGSYSSRGSSGMEGHFGRGAEPQPHQQQPQYRQQHEAFGAAPALDFGSALAMHIGGGSACGSHPDAAGASRIGSGRRGSGSFAATGAAALGLGPAPSAHVPGGGGYSVGDAFVGGAGGALQRSRAADASGSSRTSAFSMPTGGGAPAGGRLRPSDVFGR